MRYSVLAFLAATASAQSLSEKIPGFGSKPVPHGPTPSGCSDYEIIIGRGTSEPGPFGTIVGDPLVASVKKQLPLARGYAVQYPADATPGSPTTGAADVIKRITAQAAACPNQKFALSGYSQGARVLHMALSKLDAALLSKIVAITVFGDPGARGTGTPERPVPAFPEALSAKVVWNCVKADPACDKDSTTDMGPHLKYNTAGGIWISQSAKFIVAGFKGESLPAVENRPLPPPRGKIR